MMGAYGAALYAKQMKKHEGYSGILSYEEIYSAVGQVIEKANKLAAKKNASNESDAQ